MVTISMIAMIVGILVFCISRGNPDKSLRNGSIFMTLGGIIGGCFATPSRDMPNGMPGAGLISGILIAVGVYMIAKMFFKSQNSDTNNENEIEQTNNKIKNSIPVIIAAVIIVIFIAIASASSSSSGGSSSKPWKDLGVSEKEYMEIYNYYKYGN